MEYTFKKAYNTPSGSTFYVGEKYPEHYLIQKVPLLFKDIILKDEYLVLSSKVSLEDTTKEPIIIGENKTKTLSTFELKEKEDITDTTIYINEISLEDLDIRLKRQFSSNYIGAVQYSISYTSWQDVLFTKINSAI